MSLKCAVFITIINILLVHSSMQENAFVYHELVPDVLSSPPDSVLKVTFPSGAEVQLGKELSISEVAGSPTLEWKCEADRYYTIVMCDADPPSRANPEARSFLHWLVVNTAGCDVTSGLTLTSLRSSNPEPGTGLHRYLLLVYQQPGVLRFEEEPDNSFERRRGFSLEAFSNKYKLGNSIAGNFYQTENHGDLNK